ncbi:hypothetical protein [Bradyrhizobium ivorense]|nr:hypothetical protein [Bradyrhizobium ivorense]
MKIYTGRGNNSTKRFKKIAEDAWHISIGLREKAGDTSTSEQSS